MRTRNVIVDGKATIQIIDDSGPILRTIKGFWQDDCDVKIAISGKLALTMLPKVASDLILLDIEMPELNGLDTFDE